MSTSQSKLKVLTLNGNCSHGWPELTAALEAILTAAGRFDVEVSTSPSQRSSESEWNKWHPRFSDYDAVISTYEGRMPSEAAREDFEAYIRSGHGALILHSSVGAFEGWRAYNEMVGLGWRNASAGRHVFIEDSGEIVYTPPFHGVGSGHGKQHTYPVRNRQPNHPIMEGVPDLWMHGMDELYHGMRGPAKNLPILASAYSAKDQWGSGDHEPMLWTTSYGEGRVAATVLGHRWYDDRIEGHPIEAENGPDALHCVGYQTLIARSVEWVATSAVTIGVPEPFPNADKTSIVNPDKVNWSAME